jgi:hypothetical protein
MSFAAKSSYTILLWISEVCIADLQFTLFHTHLDAPADTTGCPDSAETAWEGIFVSETMNSSAPFIQNAPAIPGFSLN